MPDPHDSDPLDALAAEFAARLRAGDRPDPNEFAARLPGRTEEARAALSGVAMLESLKQTGDTDSPPPMSAGAPPDQLGEFRIVRELGRGGMGVVYEAVQEPLGRPVALKVLPGGPAADPLRRARFQREAQAVARLHHTHIVPVFAVGETDGHCYFAMQLIRGRSLDRACGSTDSGTLGTDDWTDRPLPADATDSGVPPAGIGYYRWACRLIADAADALEHAHSQGVLHRDMKPSNLLLDTAGQVWVTDFGVAKLREEADLTGTGAVVGTLRYMPPERFYGVSDAQGDVYGLGLTLYELLTRRPAFPDASPTRLVKLITDTSPPRPRRLAADIPADLETVVLAAIDRDRARRYPSAAAFAADLRRFLDDRPILARRTGPLGRLVRWGRRNPALAGAVAAVGLLLAAVATVSTAAYVTTARAKEEEAEQRRAAEQIATAALVALNRAYERFDPSRTPAADGSESPTGVPAAGLSPEMLPLLADMLDAYRQIAKAGQDYPQLVGQRTEAHRRAGDLCRLLGQLPAAADEYEQAIALYAEQPTADARLARARACNACGRVLTDLHRFDAATARHEQAVALLTDTPEDEAEPAVRFELARAYAALDARDFLLTADPGRDPPIHPPGGKPRAGPPPGPPPGQERRPSRAVPILRELLQQDNANPDYRHLLAVCLANGRPNDPEALALLRALALEYPLVPAHAVALCRVVARPGPFHRDPGLLAEAEATAADLSARYPRAAEYAVLHAQVLEKTGLVRQEAGRSATGEPPLRQAVAIMTRLVVRHPDVPAYRLRLGMIERALARTLLDQGNDDEAVRLLVSAVGRAEVAYRAAPKLTGLLPFLRMAYKELAFVRERQGDPVGTAAATQKAQEYGAKPDR